MTGPLTMLDGMPKLRPLFCTADPIWVAACEAAHASGQPAPPEPPMQLAPDAPLDTAARLHDYGAEALRRLRTWCCWHLDRAEARGIPSAAPWLGIAALADLSELIDDLGAAWFEDDAAKIKYALIAAHEGIFDVKAGAENDAWRVERDRALPDPRGTPAFDQCCETDQGPMRSVLLGFEVIADIRRGLREGEYDDQEALAEAADVFAFGWLAETGAEAV